jgi:hypothetical protein
MVLVTVSLKSAYWSKNYMIKDRHTISQALRIQAKKPKNQRPFFKLSISKILSCQMFIGNTNTEVQKNSNRLLVSSIFKGGEYAQ